MVDYPDLINLSRNEIIEEYCKLFDRFQDLRESNELDSQKIHELKRSLDTATAAQTYLSQELDLYANADNGQTENELRKTQAELVEVKRKYSKIEVSFASLQQDYNILSEENMKIIQNLEESLRRKEQVSCETDEINVDDFLLRIQLLETENMDLLQKIDDFEERSVCYTLTIAEYEKNIEILTDQNACLEENLKSKRENLDEKLEILESTQEQLAEANSKIAMLNLSPDNNNGRKGNSLFAEVDDQRQAMKHLLAAQKKNYDYMRKIYNESEHEIRRLKRENISMRTELEACSTIFCSADKIYQEKLNERVRNLFNQNDELERKLKWTQERIKELAADKGVLFFDSMLEFCKQETDDLKSQLHSVRIQNASLEEQLRNSQQDMARWRFESLKSRCVLIDREHLLTENKIYFKPMNEVDYNIGEKDVEEAKPRIHIRRRSSILDNLIHRKSGTPSKEPKTQETMHPKENIVNDNINLINLKIKTEQKESLLNIIDLTTTPAKIVEKTSGELSPSNVEQMNYEIMGSTIINNFELNASLNMAENKQEECSEDKENNTINSIDDVSISDNFAKLIVKPPSPMRPSQRSLEKQNVQTFTPPSRSILTKQQDLLFKDSGKNVKFSAIDNIIHNLSPETTSPKKDTTSVKTESNSTTAKVNSKSTVKQTRTKSNVVVRRVVVSSKHN